LKPKEIREIAIDSAAAYYRYLDKNEKGIQEIDVHALIYQSLQHCIIRLQLSSKLMDIEQVGFKLLTDNKIYDISQIKILEYDNDKNSLLIKVTDANVMDNFRNLRNRDIKVIVDLKFLITRVGEWYKMNGSKVKLPTKSSSCGTGESITTQPLVIEFLEGLEPSENQKQSLYNIFQNPFSYVWGAPGTGKTQFVLAYAVLHYMRNDKRVAIVAPTNNAIEQVLRGVIRMIDKAGIERKKIVRLGAPSRKFAEEFPEVCEDMDIVKKQMETDKQINLLKRVIEFKTKGQAILPQNLSSLLFEGESPSAQARTAEPIVAPTELLINFIENCSDDLPHNVHFLLSEYANDSPDQLKIKLDLHMVARDKLSSNTEQIKNANVIACTLDKYIGDSAVFSDVQHIFLDEAGYANMVKALTLFINDIPIAFLGDHKQLPPVCELNDLSIEKEEEYNNVCLWAQSAVYVDTLFSQNKNDILRQYVSNTAADAGYISKTTLDATYRFGENLAVILGKHVYDTNFHSAIHDNSTKILYTHAQKNEEPKSRISMMEVMAIQQITTFLKSNHIDYAILTPYIKQLRLLGKHLPQERQDLKIFTVHGSQGREWDTVLLSVVDTRDKWFVDSTNLRSKGLNLLNTAVSRAKRRLIIVCDAAYWKAQHGQLLTDLINTGQELTI
jgi:hypothetical protein